MNDRYSTEFANPTLITSKGSTRSRASQLSREALSVESFIPEELIPETQNLIAFFEQYYQWMNQEYVSASSANESKQVSTSRNAKSLYLRRSLDEYIDSNQQEIQNLFDEIARNLPNDTAIDFRIVLKHILTLYNQKGGEESIQSFFRILYNIASSVYYPWDDVLVASDGRWDGEKFLSNKGFLSDAIHLQDSNYWQRFSYDIKVGVQEGEWRSIYEALIHPIGFKFFASFILILFGSARDKVRTPYPTLFLSEDGLGAAFKIVILALMENKPKYLDTLFQMMYVRMMESTVWEQTFTSLSFYNPSEMQTFDSITLSDLSINNKKLNIGSYISSENPMMVLANIDQNLCPMIQVIREEYMTLNFDENSCVKVKQHGI